MTKYEALRAKIGQLSINVNLAGTNNQLSSKEIKEKNWKTYKKRVWELTMQNDLSKLESYDKRGFHN
jgi:hypothetical protein